MQLHFDHGLTLQKCNGYILETKAILLSFEIIEMCVNNTRVEWYVELLHNHAFSSFIAGSTATL